MTINLETALDDLRTHADITRSIAPRGHRMVMGVAPVAITNCAKKWRSDMDLPDRLDLARALWEADLWESRIAAAKLLTQARIRPDDAVWDLISAWCLEVDDTVICDAVAMAGQKRVLADINRVDELAPLAAGEDLWGRRVALVMVAPWAKMNHLKEHDRTVREQALDWAASYLESRDPRVQKAVAGWLRDLSKHDADRVRAFLEAHGAKLVPESLREANAHL